MLITLISCIRKYFMTYFINKSNLNTLLKYLTSVIINLNNCWIWKINELSVRTKSLLHAIALIVKKMGLSSHMQLLLHFLNNVKIMNNLCFHFAIYLKGLQSCHITIFYFHSHMWFIAIPVLTLKYYMFVVDYATIVKIGMICCWLRTII